MGKKLKLYKGILMWLVVLLLIMLEKTLASGSWDYCVKIWDWETGKGIRSLEGHSSFVNSVAFGNEGKF